MKRLFKIFSLPENPEVLFLLVFGILLQMTDGSPFTMKDRWMIVWDTELPVEYFSQFVQKIIKTVLSMIVVVRCATTYAYVVSAMLVIFCLLKTSAPKLMLLWLLIAGVKSILLTFLEALVGVYVCSAFGQIRKACVEFVISKALEIIFAAYLWGSVLNIYQEMERKNEDTRKPELWEQLLLQRDGGRQRARSLPDESTLFKTACLNNFEFKDVPQIILQMLRRGDEMSRDSLLDPGMMLASVSNMGSFDNLKTSQSLGELGFVDLRSAQVVGLEEDETSSPQDKALKFLKLTWSDVRRAQRNKPSLESDVFRIDPDTWRRVAASGAHINTPKRPRAEVYIREIHQTEPEDDSRKPRKRSFDLKFSWSFFNLYTEKHVPLQETDDDQDEESLLFREDEDEEGREETGEPTPLFMSNIKEEVVVNRIRLDFVSKKMKGNAYAELYKQDYMSVIGPEVFDKATKLRKVTSLSRVNDHDEPIPSTKQATFSETANRKKFYIIKESEEKLCQPSSSELDWKESGRERQKSGEDEKNEEFMGTIIANNEETVSTLNSTETSYSLDTEPNKIATHSGEKSENSVHQKRAQFFFDENSQIEETCERASPVPSITLSGEMTDYYEKTSPCYRKRRIKIRRIGKQTKASVSSEEQNFFKNSSTCFSHQSLPKAEFDEEDPAGHKKTEMWSFKSNTSAALKGLNCDGRSLLAAQNEKMFFLLDLFHKPLLDVLLTYNDLKKEIDVPENGKNCFWKGENGFIDFLSSRYHVRKYESEESQEKIWKSEVLKAVEAYRKESFPESTRNRFITKNLLAYYVEKSYLAKAEKEVFLSLCVENDCKWPDFNDENLNDRTLGNSKETYLQTAEDSTSFIEDLKDTEEETCCNTYCDEHTANTLRSGENSLSNTQCLDFNAETKLSKEDKLGLSNRKIFKSDTHLEKLKSKVQVGTPVVHERFDLEPAKKIFGGLSEEESISSQESDEPISLYYSKAANLASPLLDVKRFIYPDHIHYSYKHVKKKGFDVDISGGFPLLVRESLTMPTPPNDSVATHPEFIITRRPMDLSFATTNAFTDWQNNDQSDVDSILSDTKKTKSRTGGGACTGKRERKPSDSDRAKNKKARKPVKSNERNADHFSQTVDCRAQVKPSQNGNFSDLKYLCPSKDYLLIEKLLKMHFQLNNTQYAEFRSPEREHEPVQISSTQLHSNKGRANSTYNPAIFLQENKTRNEKKKIETQEERTKDMFARLEREALLQSKNLYKSVGPFRKI